jgi:FHA domain/Zinc-ribbon containing domain
MVAETGRIGGGAILLPWSGPAGAPVAVAAEAERIVRKGDLAQLPRKLRFDFATLRFRFPHFAGNPGKNSTGGRDQPLFSLQSSARPPAGGAVAVEAPITVYETGSVAANGSFICEECGYQVALKALDCVPECPTCSGTRFRRASLFEHETMSGQAPVETLPIEPKWLRDLRREGDEGEYLAFRKEDGEVEAIPIPEGWTRIGRSAVADIRLDDPTVSRRHALIVKTDSGELRVLDDRSLNGLFVNGEQVEWAHLRDGDELAIGCYRLHLVDAGAHRRTVNPAAYQA